MTRIPMVDIPPGKNDCYLLLKRLKIVLSFYYNYCIIDSMPNFMY